jgi:hypothetical protein
MRYHLCSCKTQLKVRPLLLWIAALLLLPVNVFCARVPKTAPDGLKVDHIGESLKEFRSVHRKAYCRRAYGEWDEDDPKKAWLLWIHCSLEAGVTFGGYKLLSESEPRYPFGEYATFYRKRLVSITYTLSTASIESLVSLIGHECGQPLIWTKDDEGVLTGAYWGTKRLSVVIRSVPITALNDNNKTLRVTADIMVYATSVTLAVGSEDED